MYNNPRTRSFGINLNSPIKNVQWDNNRKKLHSHYFSSRVMYTRKCKLCCSFLCYLISSLQHQFLHVSIWYVCSHVFVQRHMHMCARVCVYTWLRCQESFSAVLYYTEAGALGEVGAHCWFWEVRQPSCPGTLVPASRVLELQVLTTSLAFTWVLGTQTSMFYLLSHLSSPTRVLWVGKGTIHNPTGTRG